MSRPIIMAHRANLRGPKSCAENSLDACRDALESSFGLETDIRRDAQGGFYISHDPQPRTEHNALELYSQLFARFPEAVLAINVKELGYEQDLIDLMQSGRLGKHSFLFDFELLESATPGAAQRRIRSLAAGADVRLASRLSDRGEGMDQCLSIPAEVVWADEFDSLWLTEADVRRVHASGRLFYVISPEIHGFDDAARMARWRDFKHWQVDGICTDYALQAKDFFG